MANTGEYLSLVEKPNDLEDTSINQETNYTDPYVLFDGQPIGGHVAKALNQENAELFDDEGNFGQAINNQSTKVEGIYHPIVKLNNIVLEEWQIKSLELRYENFYPEISMRISNGDSNFFEFNDSPGMNNVITVILVPAIDGAYKKISIDFSIINYYKYHNTYTVEGRVKWLPLEQQKCKGIKSINGNNKPNTWEYLSAIAKECGLGFSSTKECEDIEDRLPRLVTSRTYLDFINDQIQFGGLDENSIFDVWLDLYGYITMVNLPYIFNSDISSKNLTIKAFLGIRSKSNLMKDVEIKEVNRTFTNYNQMSTKSNIEIEDDFRWITNNDSINSSGTLQTLISFTPTGTQNGENTISMTQAQIIENSVDGKYIEDYNKSVARYTVVEVNDYNINTQRMIREQFITKITSKILEVNLLYPNLGIQRGTLINLAILESDPLKKRKLLTESDNLGGDNSTEMKNPDTGESNKDLVEQEGIMVPNIGLSGLYYVYGMKFGYHMNGNKENDIKQTLLLIKKGPLTNIENKYTSVKLDEFGLGKKSEVEASNPELTLHF